MARCCGRRRAGKSHLPRRRILPYHRTCVATSSPPRLQTKATATQRLLCCASLPRRGFPDLGDSTARQFCAPLLQRPQTLRPGGLRRLTTATAVAARRQCRRPLRALARLCVPLLLLLFSRPITKWMVHSQLLSLRSLSFTASSRSIAAQTCFAPSVRSTAAFTCIATLRCLFLSSMSCTVATGTYVRRSRASAYHTRAPTLPWTIRGTALMSRRTPRSDGAA